MSLTKSRYRMIDAGIANPKDFGAVGNGIANDTDAFQAAANTSNNIYVPPGTYVVSSITLNTAAFRLTGAGRGITTLKLTTPSGSNALTINGPGGFPNPAAGIWGALIENMTIDGSSATAMDQPAINIIGGHGAVCRNLLFTKCHSGIRFKDCHMSVIHDVSMWDLKAAVGVGILVEGYGDQYIERIYIDTTVPVGWPAEPAAGIRCTSSGNLCVMSGDVVHCRIGIDIVPGSGQIVEWFYLGPVYVDQSSDIGIRILALTGGVVRGGLLQGTWSSTAQTGIQVGANPGGIVSGLTINGSRILNCFGNGIDLQAGTGFQINAGCRIAGNGRKINTTCSTSGTTVTLNTAEVNTVFANKQCVINGVTYTIASIISTTQLILATSAGTQSNVSFTMGSNAAGISVGASLSAITIANNIFGDIDTLAAFQAWGVTVLGAATVVSITGNTFRNHAVAPIGFAGGGDVEQIISNNAGIDDTIGTTASAATLILPLNPIVKVTGTTAVTAISGPRWRGREVTLITVSGAVSFSSGSTIAAAFTSVSNRPFRIYCDGNIWYIG